jgi:hypothetical protein
MPKYLLLKHYRGGPEPHRPVPPMDRWARAAPVARRPRPPARAQRRPRCRATAYAEAARRATDVSERDHLVRQAARARAAEPCRNSRLTERPP